MDHFRNWIHVAPGSEPFVACIGDTSVGSYVSPRRVDLVEELDANGCAPVIGDRVRVTFDGDPTEYRILKDVAVRLGFKV